MTGLKSNSRLMEWWSAKQQGTPAPPPSAPRDLPTGSFVDAMRAAHPREWQKSQQARAARSAQNS